MQDSKQREFKIVAWFLTLNAGSNRKRYRKIINGLLPEAIAQDRVNKDSLKFVLEKWLKASDNDIQTISKLLNRGIPLAKYFWVWIWILGVIIIGSLFLLNSSRSNQDSSLLKNQSSNSSTVEISFNPPKNRTLTKSESVALINEYLQRKESFYAPPFDPEIATSITTGKLLEDITKPGGVIDSLKQELEQHGKYYRFGQRKIEPLDYFYASDSLVRIDVRVTEEVFIYEYDSLKSTQDTPTNYIFTLNKLEDGNWKIADRESHENLGDGE
ncbi:IMS domain-containing protein [Aliinostoc sp. HNIBRCY26]|uniref:IMS domain-containing protein n=1 Tax=Aliinostoc sp. HNIBRCY26 TaxID=3418997 RepID=UPI003CFF5691